MNAILTGSKEIQYYTYLGSIFEAIQNRQFDYNWLLTDLELNWMPDDFLSYFEDYEIKKGPWDRDNKYWVSGNQLTCLIKINKIQFIWGVISGFKKTEEIDIKNLSVIPFADGNPGFWKLGATVQHPKADIEIVCWDSGLTLLISKDQSIVKSFMDFFKDARDLDEFNSKD